MRCNADFVCIRMDGHRVAKTRGVERIGYTMKEVNTEHISWTVVHYLFKEGTPLVHEIIDNRSQHCY